MTTTASAVAAHPDLLVADPTGVELARRLIEFDPKAPNDYRFAAPPGAPEAVALAAALKPDPIPWPIGLVPGRVMPGVVAADTDPLPRADVLIVTYTVAEGHGLADVLTPGYDTPTWTPYRHGWAALKADVGPVGPSRDYDRAGLWAVTRIGPVTAVLVKSDLHPSTDGPKLPMRALWHQMIAQVKPRLVITTGTAGGIGATTLLGDVVVSARVRWDCTKRFAHDSFATTAYRSSGRQPSHGLAIAHTKLIPVNAKHLPAAPRPPRIFTDTAGDPTTVLTTDFFAFDDAANHYGLRTFQPDAKAVEMDDAALGLACTDLANPPAWVSVRNASDPQMDGATVRDETKQAAAIYEKYGYWTTIGSAITCWALAASVRPAQ